MLAEQYLLGKATTSSSIAPRAERYGWRELGLTLGAGAVVSRPRAGLACAALVLSEMQFSPSRIPQWPASTEHRFEYRRTSEVFKPKYRLGHPENHLFLSSSKLFLGSK